MATVTIWQQVEYLKKDSSIIEPNKQPNRNKKKIKSLSFFCIRECLTTVSR